MGTLGTFLLVVAAFVGTVMLFANPGPKLEKWLRGKKTSELEAEAKAWVDTNDTSEIVAKGCGFIFFVLLSISYTFVVEPLAIIAALVNKIGYQPFAYAMLAIVALSWMQFSRSILSIKKKPAAKGTVVTEDGKKIEGTVINVDEEIKLNHPAWLSINRVFFSLPTIYLWYLFLVIIGVLTN